MAGSPHSPAKFLKPPLIWANNKSGLLEDRSQDRWTPDIRRQMRHGTYNWNRHDEPADRVGTRDY